MNMRQQIDHSKYSWRRGKGVSRDNHYYKLTGTHWHNDPIIELKAGIFSNNGYYRLFFFDKEVGLLKDKPTRQLRNQALKLFKEFHSNIRPLPYREMTGFASIKSQIMLADWTVARIESLLNGQEYDNILNHFASLLDRQTVANVANGIEQIRRLIRETEEKWGETDDCPDLFFIDVFARDLVIDERN